MSRRRERGAAAAPDANAAPGAGARGLIAVCGLHGGAGTTSIAALLAAHAAARHPAGRVLAVELDARRGELAGRLGAATPHSLADLAVPRADREGRAALVERRDGLRILAAAQPRALDAPADAARAHLMRARAAHDMCVVDAGSVSSLAAEAALVAADTVVWTADPARLSPVPLHSPLTRPARAARWILALVPVSSRSRPSRRGLARIDELAAVVRVPRDAHTDTRRAAATASRLLRAAAR